jgi:hypothetical protein
MGRASFQGAVRFLSGSYAQGPGTTLNITASAITLDPDTYAGRMIRVNVATTVITLPPINPVADPQNAGPGPDPNTQSNVGCLYTFVIETAATSVAFKTQSPDKIIGSLNSSVAAGTMTSFPANPASTTTVTMNGGTTGGAVGSTISFLALASGKYLLQDSNVLGVGAQTTPFS